MTRQESSALIANRDEVLRIATKHGARNVRFFGSTARGEATEASDIDLLVTMDEGRSLLDLIALGQDLEELLGKPVDVVSDRGLSKFLRDRIISEAKLL